jgi:tRNA A-37 threonylcarbamoyl transferase component Bud32
MMEECNMLEEGALQKLRIFLLSAIDLDNSENGLGKTEGDSEVQYVVAVNGMDFGSRRNSFVMGSTSGNMDELLSLGVDREYSQVAGAVVGNNIPQAVDDIPPTGKSSQFVAQSSFQPSSESNPRDNIAYRDIEGHTDVKSTRHNNYDSDQSFVNLHARDTEVSNRDGSVKRRTEFSNEQISENDAIVKEIKMKRENSSQKLNDFEKVQSTGTKKVAPSNLYDTHVSSLISKDEASVVSATDAIIPQRVNENGSFPSQVVKEEKLDKQYKDDNLYDSEIASTDSFGEVGVYPTDSSNEPPAFPQNMFRSERLPRELSGLSRLSKSDDSSGAQFLVSHAHSDVSQQISEALSQVVEKDETGLDFVQLRDGLRVPSGKTVQYNMPARGDKLKGLPKAALNTNNIKEGSVTNAGYSEIRDTPPEKEASGSSLFTPTEAIREKVQDESVAKLRQVPLSEVPVKHTDVSTKKVQIQPATGASESQDILIDINDRFPPDFLSDIFSKAKVTDSTERLPPLPSDDTGLSLNVENHEPKHWSYFQKLAQEDFVRNDVSLMDLDHLGFVHNAEEATTTLEYGLATSKEDCVAADHMDSAVDFPSTAQKKSPGFTEPNIVDIPSDYEPQTMDTQNVHYDDATTLSGRPDVDYQDENTEGQTPTFPLIDLAIADFDPSSLQIIMNEDLEELRELGSGTFGTVYHGKWRGTDVAIKRIKKICFTGRSSEQERLTVEFWREAEILSRLHHPNVVAFYGVVQDGPGGTLATVAEFMVNGSLRHVLLSKDRHLDRRKRLVIAMDAAFGMEYLHSKNIVHFDLKCDNLLVNLKDPSRPICKVADFGLSKIKRNTLVTGGVRGTLPWMAPELLNGSSSKVSEKVDVFSFGIVLWEILTGEEPYSNMHYGAIIGGIVNNTLRPQIPSYCDADWKLLMEHCWAPDPSVRPSFTEIARRLRLMLSAASSQGRPQGNTKQNQVPK